MNITKEQFIKIMNGIKKQADIDAKNNKAFSVILENDFVSNVKNVLYDVIIDFLETATNDKGEWITYFVYELDFGKENNRLQVYDKDDSEIPLSTLDDLWNILIGDTDE